MRTQDADASRGSPPTASEPGPSARLRIAVVSTPRSGNTWLRNLLADIYGLEELAVHRPDQVDWSALPERLALQVHWRPSKPVVGLMEQHEFQVVTLSRHPLDMLISLLNYRQYVEHLEGWTDDGMLLGASPRSAGFLEFSCGATAEELMATSVEWMRRDRAIGVRYEDLVADTAGTLEALARRLSPDLRRPVTEAAAARAIKQLRSDYNVWHYHYWQGKPGHWKTLLPAREAQRIAAAQPAAFSELGYACDPDAGLDDLQAELNWFRLQYHSIREHLTDERAKHEVTRRNLQAERVRTATAQASAADADARTASTLKALDVLSAKHAALSKALRWARSQLAAARTRLADVESLGPYSLELARAVQTLARKHPLLATAVKQLVRPRRQSA
jgi:hypothetical protein